MDHTIALIEQSHQGDKKAREQLVEENVGLVWSIVKRFYGRGVEPDDLFQIGSIGLLKAIDKFDPTFEVKFSTYAVPMIMGELKRFLRDDGLIKVSRTLKETAAKAYQLQESMQKELGRDPEIQEIAEILEIDTEMLVMALESVNEVESIHKVIYQNEGNEIELLDKLTEESNEESNEERIIDHLLLNQLIEELGSEERRLIYLRYFADKTQSEIGQQLGISQVQVSRMEKRILNTLREKIG